MILGVVPHAHFESHCEQLVECEDRIICGSLTHYASALLQRCFQDREDLLRSLHRAIIALRSAGVPASRHFRTVFLGGNELTEDWLISDLGLRLLLINANVLNPNVARLQVQILSDGFESLAHD